jgi:type VI secretion system protein ImpJ
MSLIAKPLWMEGLLVRPQHLQQQNRWIEHLLEGRVLGLRSNGWGIRALGIDRSLLALGKFALTTLTAILPDGTLIDLPAEGPLPEPRAIPALLRNATIKIAVAVRPRDNAETSNDPLIHRRYSGIDQAVRDTTAPERAAVKLRVGRLNLRVLIEGEAEDDCVTLGLARVKDVEPNGAVVLSTTYCPPCLDIHVAERLLGHLNEARSLIKSRADALAARSDMSRIASDAAGVIDLLTLAILNGHESQLECLASTPGAHPAELFQCLRQLVAQLATFSEGRRPPADLPVYRHDDIEGAMAPLIDRLREFLIVVIERNAVPLELQQRGYGIMTSIVADRTLFQDSRFVLVAGASMPAEVLRSQLPPQMKVGPVEQIRDLVNLQLPGIPLRALPVAPPELPFLQNAVYFELDQSAELWRNLARSNAFAMHVSGEYPDLHLEFGAIRRKRP